MRTGEDVARCGTVVLDVAAEEAIEIVAGAQELLEFVVDHNRAGPGPLMQPER